MSDQPNPGRKPGPATEVAHLGREPARHLGAINTPVYRASTILFDSVADYEASQRGQSKSLNYGLRGLPTVTDLQSAVATLEGGHAALAVPSGLAATTLPLLALTSAGDHVLVTDSVYGPTRRFCDQQPSRSGVEVAFYDPLIGRGHRRAPAAEHALVFRESPGSLSFEVQDVSAIAAVAHAHGALVLLDNTWATPLHFRAFDHGVDVSVIAGTGDTSWRPLRRVDRVDRKQRGHVRADADRCSPSWAMVASPSDDASSSFVACGRWRCGWSGTAAQCAAADAEWLAGLARGRRGRLPGAAGGARTRASEVAMLRRAPADCSVWCSRAGGESAPSHAMLDGLRLFRWGVSWGGFESLAIPVDPTRCEA